MDRAIRQALWRFVRCDTTTTDFEAWVYAYEATLLTELGVDLHLALLEMNYADRNQVERMRERLEGLLRPALACECEAVADEDVIPMGMERRDERFFATVDEAARHGGKAWWLWLGKCKACGDHWLIAQEERIYDDYFVDRLSDEDAAHILADKQWPAKYLTYEDVLRTGRVRSKPCRFVDRMANSLVWTVQELRRDRPEIDEREMADLLGIDALHAKELLKKSNTLRESYLVAIINKWLVRLSEKLRN
ncbi:hypothetical protein [Asticcacaulis sp. AND118]|uniref:hypothetical protein n=1 Tax=Asticcacaulis sp. AND118 TaxID=2840468 RepID=UPI001CFFB752|nr:hypothetical protein [Asticcacaulis sp. AND118]UDF05486.1 hypothetical protein LH365_14900 [Asticcacaulis sp. AND118]